MSDYNKYKESTLHPVLRVDGVEEGKESHTTPKTMAKFAVLKYDKVDEMRKLTAFVEGVLMNVVLEISWSVTATSVVLLLQLTRRQVMV